MESWLTHVASALLLLRGAVRSRHIWMFGKMVTQARLFTEKRVTASVTKVIAIRGGIMASRSTPGWGPTPRDSSAGYFGKLQKI